ncbi:MAG TPA: DUF3141 domain-containing protein [Alphaproteobacteria bacterium]|nr:DUF3141 domain-containing protein [Alphaproteobacteria bacterium]
MNKSNPLLDYLVDSWQRGVLFLDVLRQRGNQYEEHQAKTAPHVLAFSGELVMDGRTLPRPVNYGLVRIEPLEGTSLDPRKAPFIVIDPRAGHGPGIGGFKADSEIGVALKAGHPCYFIGFLPEPMPGQTIEDVIRAEAAFIEKVIALHPQADGKPITVGNCQAGWALMMLAAIRPELFGPILVAGSPLSYWAGVRGVNPMRYTGGLLGGSWLAALTSDIGNGKFDGAWLVSNFENLNPSNTYWSKLYNVYSKVDTEAPRFLEFERWWGGHVNLNAEEIQFIVDELFVGNKLARNGIALSDGTTINLRNIRSPILVFCSHGDNITPPQQALGWILDLYDSVEDLQTHGQTIIYCVHESIGHLGIFVSAKVARKEHDEFASNMDFIGVLPPGLYEAVLIAREAGDASAGRDGDAYSIRFEARTLDDIRALGTNTFEDERRFEAVAHISNVNRDLYKTFASPWIRAFSNDTVAEIMRQMHPARLQFSMWSDKNPFMRVIGEMAEKVRAERAPVGDDNPFRVMEKVVSRQIESGLDAYRDTRDKMLEQAFLACYGAPTVQALAGLGVATDDRARPRGTNVEHQQFIQERIADLRAKITKGGPREALTRSLLYIGMPRAAADERGFDVLRAIRARLPADQPLPLEEFRRLVREQFFMLLIDQRAAMAALPLMIPEDAASRRVGLEVIRAVVRSAGIEMPEVARRFAEIEALWAGESSHSGTRADESAKPREPAPSGPDVKAVVTRPRRAG